MGQRKINRMREDEERRFRLNELDWPKDRADAQATEACQDCVEVRQEFGRWMVFRTCPIGCPHEHHKSDSAGMA